MDHETASQIQAAEKYVTGDLSAPERDQFEEHFADCSRCMDEVWMASAFAANVRAEFRDRALGQARPQAALPVKAAAWHSGFWPFRWQIALPAFAALMLAAFAVYQSSVTIRALRAPQAFMPAVILDGATRGSGPQVPAGSPLRFQMALAPGAENGRVWAELTPSGSNRVLSGGWVNVPPANEPLDVYFPIRLNPGRYTIVVRAGQAGGAELAHNSFDITAQGASTQ